MELTSFVKQGKEQAFRPVFGSAAELLRHHAKEFGEKEAIIGVDVDSGSAYSLSYEKLFEMAAKTANFLFAKGIQKGDRVAFLFHNTPEILILELACGLLGASSAPLDSKRDTTERKIFKLKDANAKILFLSALKENAEESVRIQEVLPSLLQVLLNEKDSLASTIQDQSSIPEFPAADSMENEYVLLYTSGTTANPKGVPLSLRACFANAEGIMKWQNLSSEDRFLIVLPLHHVNSTTMSLATLLAGGTIILSSRYSASKFWDIVEGYHATITSVVPTVLHDLLGRKEEFFAKSRNLSSLKRILVGSAPVLPGETLRFMETFGINVVQGYGQTETALRVTGVPIDLPREQYLEMTRENSIGKELVFCNVTVLMQDGREAHEGEEGEICIRGPVLGDGYLNNPEETEKAFSNGWFHSGDLGFYRVINDEKYFFIKGRIKEIIIKGGVKISPVAVEDALLKNFPDIDEVCVVGYSDARMGEEVAAVITLQSLASSVEKPGFNEKEFVERIQQEGSLDKIFGLSSYEAPAKVFVTSTELPKTSTGKIQRVKVKEMVAEWIALRQAQGEQTEHLYCRLIDAREKEILEKAVEINNKRWSLASDTDEFELRARNGYVIGVFLEEEKLLGTLSALQTTREKLEKAKTWDEATGQGTLQTHDPAGEVMLCVSIIVVESPTTQSLASNKKKPDFITQKLADKVIDDYLATNLDNVIRFHRKPKGGMEKGGEVAKVLPQGRPEDGDAMGYNVLIEYPEIGPHTKIVKTKNASPSILLIEQAMLLAKEKGCSKVAAFSRPAQFRAHLAKALDESFPFEPYNAEEFASFAKLLNPTT